MYIHLFPSGSIDLTECKGCHCLAARRHARAITRLYEHKLRPHGLRATQFSILAALALKGPTRMTELAEFLVLERTTLTRGAARLVDAGWLDEAPSRDARQRILCITPSGLRKLHAAYPAWKQAQATAQGEPSRIAPRQGGEAHL